MELPINKTCPNYRDSEQCYNCIHCKTTWVSTEVIGKPNLKTIIFTCELSGDEILAYKRCDKHQYEKKTEIENE